MFLYCRLRYLRLAMNILANAHDWVFCWLGENQFNVLYRKSAHWWNSLKKWCSLFVQWLGWFTVHLCALTFDNGVRFHCTDHNMETLSPSPGWGWGCSSQASSHCCRYVTFLDIVNNSGGNKKIISWSLAVNLYTRPIYACASKNYQYDIPQNTIHRWKPESFESTNVSSFKDPTWWMIMGVKFPIHILYVHQFACHFLIGYQNTVCWHCLFNQ